MSQPTLPDVCFAPIACGEKIVADEAAVEDLRKIHSKLAGIEKESFGVAVAAAKANHRPGFLAIRGICDFANSEKNDDWHPYAAEAAAAYAVGLLKTAPVRQRTLERPVQVEKTLVVICHQSLEPLLPQNIRASLPPVLQTASVREILVDQTDLFVNGRLIDPMGAARRQSDLAKRLLTEVETYPDVEIAYFGIAHIPLLFLAGYHLSSKQFLRFFEHDRHARTWKELDAEENFPVLTLAGMPPAPLADRGEVIVRVSISYLVTSDAIAGLIANPIASLHLAIDLPKIDAVTSAAQLKNYSVQFRAMLDEIHNKLPNTQCIHLFYSGPASLAVNFGQQISRTIHPPIIAYNYYWQDNPCYSWGLKITSPIDSADFLVRVKPPAGA